jgi:N-acetyl-gamma-glutamyl-phosphate reductase
MNTDAPVSAGVLGATGYAGRELIGLLARHPRVKIAAATSESEAGLSLARVHRAAPDLALVRADNAALEACDVVFSCLPHGASAVHVERARAAGARVIDLSSDLRVLGDTTPTWAQGAVYGLSELHRERIAGAELVANPGCYPTAALLALAPLVRRGLIAGPAIINAASGVTGAGRSAKRELLFAEVGEDFRAYAAGNVHRHLAEMRDQAAKLANGAPSPELVFTPHLLPVRRGILETIYVPLSEPLDPDALLAPWQEDYAGEPFVEILPDRLPTLADAIGSNRVAIGATAVADVERPLLIVVAAIDNLLKGAAGQAVQNLNLMLGWPETEALS